MFQKTTFRRGALGVPVAPPVMKGASFGPGSVMALSLVELGHVYSKNAAVLKVMIVIFFLLGCNLISISLIWQAILLFIKECRYLI